jgi:GH24 family phage-related lysozyme (muramidase)
MKELLSFEPKEIRFREQEEGMLAPAPRIIVRDTGLAYDTLPGSPTTPWRDPSGQVHVGIGQHYDVIHLASGRSLGPWLLCEEDVKHWLERIAELEDWKQSYQQLRLRRKSFDVLAGQVAYALMATVLSYALPLPSSHLREHRAELLPDGYRIVPSRGYFYPQKQVGDTWLYFPTNGPLLIEEIRGAKRCRIYENAAKYLGRHARSEQKAWESGMFDGIPTMNPQGGRQ